jgi:hypothetical protein
MCKAERQENPKMPGINAKVASRGTKPECPLESAKGSEMQRNEAGMLLIISPDFDPKPGFQR